MSDNNFKGKNGLVAGRDVNFGDVSGQVAIGKNISQNQQLTAADRTLLLETLKQFQKDVAGLGLPCDEAAIVKGNINIAIKETEKDSPDVKKIQSRFQGALDTIKEVGNTIETVSGWEWTKRALKILGKIGLAVLI